MENHPMQHKKLDASSILSMLSPNSNSPQSGPSAPLPPYSNPSQYPPTSGMPYPQNYILPTQVMGCPQPYAPPPAVQPYYPQPGPSYQAPQPQQQQQQQVVVVNNQPTAPSVPMISAPSVPMIGAIVLSCFVFWCCGWLFGGIAFILAMVGQCSASAGDTRGATQLRNASYGLSIAGIVIAIIIIVVFVVANSVGSAAKQAASHPYYYSYTTKSTLRRCYNAYSGEYYYC